VLEAIAKDSALPPPGAAAPRRAARWILPTPPDEAVVTALAQALAKMSLYSEGHPARARAADVSFAQMRELQKADPCPSFSFLGSEVVYNDHALRELRDWDWANKLAAAGVQRLEFEGAVEPEEYRAFLDDVLSRAGEPEPKPRAKAKAAAASA